MKEWKSYKLGDIVKICSGLAYKADYLGHGDAILLGMGCVSFTDKFLKKGARSYNGEIEDRFIVKPGDIVLATRQQSDNLPILGMPAIIPEEYQGKRLIAGSNLYIIRNESDIDNRFLYWLLKTPAYINHISSCKTGTTVRMITKKDIESFEFACPGKEERNRISDFLWSIEDKIDLNNRINHNLEQQAQALYKSWFIDFEPFKNGKFVESELGMIPEGWIVKNLLELSNVFDSKRKPLSGNERSVMDKIYPYYGATSIMDYVSGYIFDGTYLLMGEDGSVITDEGFPFLQYVTGKFWPNNHAHVLQGKNGFSTEMLHCALLRKNVKASVTGAVQAKISQANMAKILFPCPPSEILEQFDEYIQVIYCQLRNIVEQNKNLTITRDQLLPKLLSGVIITC